MWYNPKPSKISCPEENTTESPAHSMHSHSAVSYIFALFVQEMSYKQTLYFMARSDLIQSVLMCTSIQIQLMWKSPVGLLVVVAAAAMSKELPPPWTPPPPAPQALPTPHRQMLTTIPDQRLHKGDSDTNHGSLRKLRIQHLWYKKLTAIGIYLRNKHKLMGTLKHTKANILT